MIKLSIEVKKLEEVENLSRQVLDSFFTSGELAGSSRITLAGKLAAKTSFLKNAGLSAIPEHYRKTEVIKTPSGRPAVKIIDAELNEKFSKFKTSVSISHTQDTAIAICVFYNPG